MFSWIYNLFDRRKRGGIIDNGYVRWYGKIRIDLIDESTWIEVAFPEEPCGYGECGIYGYQMFLVLLQFRRELEGEIATPADWNFHDIVIIESKGLRKSPDKHYKWSGLCLKVTDDLLHILLEFRYDTHTNSYVNGNRIFEITDISARLASRIERLLLVLAPFKVLLDIGNDYGYARENHVLLLVYDVMKNPSLRLIYERNPNLAL